MVNIDSLEIHVSNHCNMSCMWCMHFSPYESFHFINLENLQTELNVLNGKIKVGTIRLLGGEPLLNTKIDKVIGIAKNSKVSNKVSIATNGFLLKLWMDNVMWKDIDECEVTLYPHIKDKHDEILKICHSIAEKFKVKFYIYYCEYFRKPGSLSMTNNEELTKQVFKTCLTRKWQCFNLFDGKIYLCPQAFAFPRNGIGELDKRDYIDIHSKTFESDLQVYVNRTEPLKICSYCYGSCGDLSKHCQIKIKKNPLDMVSSEYDEGIDMGYLNELLTSSDVKSNMGTLIKIEQF